MWTTKETLAKRSDKQKGNPEGRGKETTRREKKAIKKKGLK